MTMIIYPGPYVSRRLKKSRSMPCGKIGRGGQEGKEKDRESKRGLLRVKFPPSPRARSSASVLGKDRDKGKNDGDEDCNNDRNPPPPEKEFILAIGGGHGYEICQVGEAEA